MDITANPVQTDYDLSGGSKVSVFKPYGDKSYFALVHQNGLYPEAGKKSKNKGRKEFCLVVEGSIVFHINNERLELKEGESVQINDGDEYKLDGIGKVVVFVEDEKDGKTEIINE